MADDETGDPGPESGLRWIMQQLGRSVEQLRDLDLEMLERMTGMDPERARQFLDDAGQWLSRADAMANETASRFAAGFMPDAQPSSRGPHPLDRPTDAQGQALSAIDSGRWTVQAGSHVLSGTGEGPAPPEATDLVGELRARDWIDAGGQLTLVGRDTLRRWIEASRDA